MTELPSHQLRNSVTSYSVDAGLLAGFTASVAVCLAR